MSLSRTVARLFPVPRYLSPHAAGIDITDASIKWVALRPQGDHFRVSSWGEVKLEPGIVESGTVKNEKALAEALVTIRKQLGGIRVAHAALPEEGAFVFSMRVPTVKKEEIESMIEFELVSASRSLSSR